MRERMRETTDEQWEEIIDLVEEKDLNLAQLKALDEWAQGRGGYPYTARSMIIWLMAMKDRWA
jgi:hypothetical protein